MDTSRVPGPGPCAHRAAQLRVATVRGVVPLARVGRENPGGSDRVPVVLTPREMEVLALVGRGWSDGAIAAHLFISKKTASVHVANIKGKLGTENRVETALAAQALGLRVPAARARTAHAGGHARVAGWRKGAGCSTGR